MKNCIRARNSILCVFLFALWVCANAFGQSQPSQQSSSQAQPQAQPAQKEESTGDAARKSQKEKPKSKKVYTEEDLSGMRGGGVSVVGDEKGSGTEKEGTKKEDGKAADGKAGTDVVPMSGSDEAYWRGKACELLDEIAALDNEIAKTKEEIKKYGTDGFDAQSGLRQNVIYIDNRNAKLQQLEKRKAELGKKLDQLQEEGRKAGASPAWFR